jgi:hypothetical protein
MKVPPIRFAAAALVGALAPAHAACRAPDPRQTLELVELETYWAVDSAVADRVYIAPVARFQVRNKGGEAIGSVQATASFRRRGEEQLDWGTAWEQVASSQKKLEAGQTKLVVLKSDGRYYSQGDPETFFEHKLFKDARVQVYLRQGASPWVSFAEADVDRRIGTRRLKAPEPATAR